MSALELESESRTHEDDLETPNAEPLSLSPGDNLSREDFLRIWEQLPNLKHADLIEGVVYMPSPLGPEHADRHFNVSAWLSVYCHSTPGSAGSTNGTWLMLGSAPQPDIALRVLPEFGGQSYIKDKYPGGAPETAIELASSSAAYDLHQKLKLYCDAGVQEYLVIVLRKPEIRWHRRVDNRYELITPSAEGVFHSSIFPGFWLNGPAFLHGDMNAVLATLQEGIRSPEHVKFVAKLQAVKESIAKMEKPT